MNTKFESNFMYYRKFIIFLFDLLFCLFSTWASFSILYNKFHVPNSENLLVYLFPVIIYSIVFFYFGIHKQLVRYTNLESIITLTKAFTLYLFLILLLFLIYDSSIKKTFLVNQIILFYILSILTRIYFSTRFNTVKNNRKKHKILVYGAGAAGLNLFQTVLKKSNYMVIAFVDDDLSKQNRFISGIPIISFNDIKIYKKNYLIDEIILAIPSLEINNKRKIINKLSNLNIKIKSLPDLIEFINNKNFAINDLSLNDLIERNITPLSKNSRFYHDKVILISGGGGSIGSELSRQLCFLKTKMLIIFDHSEYNLYKISSELINLIKIKKISLEIVPILGTIKDNSKLENVFKTYKPDIVLHAAAYKHVNLLEQNIIEGVTNNIIGTFNILKLSNKYKVQNFLLVSTDKAVRPTNFMGATKRISEMLVLAEARSKLITSKFSIVRFGNVLGSSGSVIPLFNSQINNREPITVTHQDVERYIMTVPEAINLILDSVELSQGGEIFLLDMGKPVKIIDLARKLINLSGLTEKNSENINGDIEIKFIGLRPGEKLSEELLIDSKSAKTSNENIYIATEEFSKNNEIDNIISSLKEYSENYSDEKVINLLKKHVEGFQKYYK